MKTFARRFAGGERGVAIVEFALIAPLLIFFYVGMAELCQVLLAERKTAHIASSVADLISQQQEVNASKVSNVLNISETLMLPYKPASGELKLRVTSVYMDKTVAKVRWSDSRHIATRVKDAPVENFPSASTGGEIIADGETVIMAEVEYAFATPYSDMFTFFSKLVATRSATKTTGKNYTFRSRYYLRPRRSAEVAYKV